MDSFQECWFCATRIRIAFTNVAVAADSNGHDGAAGAQGPLASVFCPTCHSIVSVDAPAGFDEYSAYISGFEDYLVAPGQSEKLETEGE